MSKDTNVDFTIMFAKGKLDELEATLIDNDCNGVDKLLKLFTTNTNTNMHLFNSEDKLKKYETIEEIINDYYETRINMYQTRKEYLVKQLEHDLLLLSNKAKYIKENLDGTIDLRKKKREQVVELLKNKGYDIIDPVNDIEYNYLVKMPMDSVTEENVEKLYKERGNKEIELENIKNTDVNQMWLNELEKLIDTYNEYKEERVRFQNGDDTAPKKKTITKVTGKKL
jgi:DNA topoisomerase-2